MLLSKEEGKVTKATYESEKDKTSDFVTSSKNIPALEAAPDSDSSSAMQRAL